MSSPIEIPNGATLTQADLDTMRKSQITIECHSALGAETPVILDDQIKTMKDIFTLRAGQLLTTYGLSDSMSIAEAEIMEIPQEIYSAETVEIIFSNGFHMICSPGTQIVTLDGIKTALELYQTHNDDKLIDPIILSLLFSTRNQQIYTTSTHIARCEKQIKALAEPLYLFISSAGTMLLPRETEDGISFICVMQ